MANSTYRVFKSAQIGAQHNKECEEQAARDFPGLEINVKDPDDKLAALDVIAAELKNNWEDDRPAEMTDEDLEASVKAEAEEIYAIWVTL